MVSPRWSTGRTAERPTFGPAVAAIAVAMGVPLMPWQRLVVEVALEVQSVAAGDPEPGAWAYDDVTVTVQRQAGKTVLLQPVVVHRCGRLRGGRVFATAQKRDKARLRWLDTSDRILESPLREDVRRKVGVGHEELRWMSTQSTFVPFAPNGDDMHGETPDLVLIDELHAFKKDEAQALMGAYVPGFTTKSGQVWKFSTAGDSDSWWLDTSRRVGRKAVEDGCRLGTAFFEWSLPDVVDGVSLDDLSDEALVQACIDHNPATGYRLRPASVWSAWTAFADRGAFLRFYGNRSAEDTASVWRAVARGVFLGQIDPGQIPADVAPALGVSVDPDSEDAAVTAAWRDGAGRMHTELLRRELGTRWVAGYVAGVAGGQSVRSVTVLNAGVSRDVAEELDRLLGWPVHRVQGPDYAAACARHRDELAARTWWHRFTSELEDAAAAVVRRKSGPEGRVWDRDGEPISAWVSNTLAGWGFDEAPLEPDLGPFRIL